jgi:hypothetical protein
MLELVGPLRERDLLFLSVVLVRRSLGLLSEVRKAEVCFRLKLLFLIRNMFVWELCFTLKVVENLLIFFELLLMMVLIDTTDHNCTPLSSKHRILVDLWREHILVLLIVEAILVQVYLWHFSILLHWRILRWLLVWWPKSFLFIFFITTLMDCGIKRSQVYDNFFFIENWLLFDFFDWITHELLKFFVHFHLKLLKLRYSLCLMLILIDWLLQIICLILKQSWFARRLLL